MEDKWRCIEYDAFLYLGPRGSDLSSLKPGPLADDDVDFNTCKERGKAASKARKKMKIDIGDETSSIDENANAKENIATELATHIRMASMRLVMQYGNATLKEQMLTKIMNGLLPPNESPSPE